eukprot:886992-Rhodomonas_salina.2
MCKNAVSRGMREVWASACVRVRENVAERECGASESERVREEGPALHFEEKLHGQYSHLAWQRKNMYQYRTSQNETVGRAGRYATQEGWMTRC